MKSEVPYLEWNYNEQTDLLWIMFYTGTLLDGLQRNILRLFRINQGMDLYISSDCKQDFLDSQYE